METKNQTSLWNVRLNIKANVSSKHVWTNHPGKMRALYTFQITTRIIISKHPKLFNKMAVFSLLILWFSALSHIIDRVL